MMNYEIFKEVVAEKFLGYMPPEYQDMRVDVHATEKVNKKLDALCLRSNKDTTGISPSIYINDMYEQYLRTEDLQAVLRNAAENMHQAFINMPTIPTMDSAVAKENIVFQLINTMQNEDMLLSVPHREMQDLSIIYRWVMSVDETGIQSTVVHQNLAEKLGLSEEELFRAAVENTRRIFPPTVRSMNDVMKDMFIRDGMPVEMIEMMIPEIPEDRMLWVISNEQGINGAASMLYEDQLQALAANLEEDLYILPSSVHEVIAVSSSMGDPYELAQMVNEINMDQVSLEERLSNQVYHYDKDLRKLTLATDTPNKRLDGKVAEKNPVYETGKFR